VKKAKRFDENKGVNRTPSPNFGKSECYKKIKKLPGTASGNDSEAEGMAKRILMRYSIIRVTV